MYILKLLDESPRHGYEIIRLLEDRFMGLYAPSAGTVYPRLAKLEVEGLVAHDEEGGRKVFRLTDAGRAELAGLADELTELEHELVGSIKDLAAEVRHDVRRQDRSDARPASKELRELDAELERLRTEVRLLARRGGVTPAVLTSARSRVVALLDELRADLGA